jgi:hypothetical protein
VLQNIGKIGKEEDWERSMQTPSYGLDMMYKMVQAALLEFH